MSAESKRNRTVFGFINSLPPPMLLLLACSGALPLPMHASHARQCNSMHSRAFGELNCKNKSSSSIYFEIYHRRLVGSTMCPLSEYVRLRFVLITCANSLMVDLNSDHPPRFISHPFPCQSSPFKWRYCASTRIILSEYPLPTTAAVAHQY